MDFISSIFSNLSELFISTTNTGHPHIDLFKVLSIAIISITTYGVILMRKIQTTQTDISKDKAENTLYHSLKDQINFLNNQVKDLSENLKETMKQKDDLFKEFTELRSETKLLQEQVNNLKSVQSENELLKKRLNEKDDIIKNLQIKNEELINELVNELKDFKNQKKTKK